MIINALIHYITTGGQERQGCADTTPQSGVNLARFCGRWYELARYDTFFQRGLEEVHADYSPTRSGRLRVVNSGISATGKKKRARAGAYTPNPRTPGLLRISFVPPYRWFYTDYRILYVDADYRTTIISGADDRHLWLMARSPVVTAQELFNLLLQAEMRGFPTKRLHITRHSLQKCLRNGE